MQRPAMTRLAWTLPALLWSGAGAHPVDEVVQGAYLTLGPGTVGLELDITPGSQVSAAILRALDPDGDQTITTAEARAYATGVLAKSSLRVDGVAVRWILAQVMVPPYQNLAVGSDTLRIFAAAKRPDAAGTHTLVYANAYQPARSQCIANVFLQPGGGWRYAVAGQVHSDDGRQLTVTYRVARP